MKNKIPENEITARIEAALYSSGKPLSLEDLSRAAGMISIEKTKKIITELINRTNQVFHAIEIKHLDDGNYVFQLKPSYTPIIRKYAQQPIIPNSILKTLSYILYEQPVTSKRLVQIRGSQIYSHLKFLEQMNFIEHENLGRLRVYRTSKKFQEYFGVMDINILKNNLLANTSINQTIPKEKTK